MKVYLVLNEDEAELDSIKVFLNKEDAQEFWFACDDKEIQEHEVIK